MGLYKGNITALKRLLLVNGYDEAPKETRRHGHWVECIISVDNDNIAYLTMPQEAFEVVQEQFYKDDEE